MVPFPRVEVKVELEVVVPFPRGQRHRVACLPALPGDVGCHPRLPPKSIRETPWLIK